MGSGSGEKIEFACRIASRSSGTRRRAVHVVEPRPGRHDEQRQQRSGRDQRTARAEPVEQERRGQRAEADGQQEQALHHAEDPRDHFVGGGALQKRHARDVDDRVADPDDPEQDERKDLIGPDREERNRHAPDEDPDPEVGGEPSPADECGRGERAQQAADADRGVEEADAGVPRVEQLQRYHDDQHVEHPVDEGLCGKEADEQAQPALPGDRPETEEELVDDRAGLDDLALDYADRSHAQHEDRRPDQSRGRHDEDSSRSERREQQAPDRGPCEDADALDCACGDVGRGQLLRCAGQRGNEGGLGRTERGRRDTDESGDHVDDDGTRIGVGRDSSATDEQRAYEIGDDHDETPVVAISEQGRERRGERGREPARQADDADRRGAALLVGVDDDGDAVGPGPDQRSGPGKLDPAEVGVRKDLPKRPTRPGQLPQESPHRAQDRSRGCVFEGQEGRFLPDDPSST